jgi:hypothetical protein
MQAIDVFHRFSLIPGRVLSLFLAKKILLGYQSLET